MGLRGIGGFPWIPKYNLSCVIFPPSLTRSSLPTSNILVTVGWTPMESFGLAYYYLPPTQKLRMPSGSIWNLEEQLPWPALLEPSWWFLQYSWNVLLYDLFYSVSIKASWIYYLVWPWYLGRPKISAPEPVVSCSRINHVFLLLRWKLFVCLIILWYVASAY